MEAQGLCFLFEAMPRVVWQSRSYSAPVLLLASCQEALVPETFLDVARGRGSPPKFLEKRPAEKNGAESLRLVGN